MKLKTSIKKNRGFILSFIIIMAAMIIIPMFMTRPFSVNVLILSAIWAIMGLGWNFIGGYAGQVSNGHAMFFAIGAYAGALSLKWFRITPWISMWLGVIICMAVAFLIGKPLFRLRGHYFAIATMALVECTRVIFLNWAWIGGSTGISFFDKSLPEWYSLQFMKKLPFYYVCLAFMAVFVILTKVMEKSKFGFYCRAIKANQDSAESSGVDAAKYKLIAYMISAGIVSVGGALYAQYIQYIDPALLLPLSNSMLIVLVCVMGGIGTVWGPVLGAFLMTSINEYARSYLAKFSGLNLVIYGIIVIIIVLFLPNGLISLLHKDRIAGIVAKFRKKKPDISAMSEGTTEMEVKP
jgi:branched-chain amino acid transport system permease protein